jgi:KipI family sensor histidine kinase inhibitor
MPDSPLRILPAGDRALLVAPAAGEDLASFVDQLREELPSGVQDIIAAAETVLVTLAGPADEAAVRAHLQELFSLSRNRTVSREVAEGEVVTIPVRYDGEDLEEVAGWLGLTVPEVVAAHTGAVWRCAFIGFAPGFGYLESSDARLVVPRRRQSRTRVDAGAVALADGYTAVYPRPTPGGWQLIGTTDLAMWDLARRPPALLQPGTRVRFVDGEPT